MSHDNDNRPKPPHYGAWSQELTGNAWIEGVIKALTLDVPMVSAEEQEHEEQPFCVSMLNVVTTPQFTLRDWNRRVWTDITGAKYAGRVLCEEGIASSVPEAMQHRTICGVTGSYHCEGECDIRSADDLEKLQGPPTECPHPVNMGFHVAEAFMQGFRDAMFGEAVCDE